jgi:hypothetical protein
MALITPDLLERLGPHLGSEEQPPPANDGPAPPGRPSPWPHDEPIRLERNTLN